MSKTAEKPQAEVFDPGLADRVKAEVEKTIQRGLKGIQFLQLGPATVGTTPKDVLLSRGTLNLYHYRPMADELYRVPVLFVMATTNKGYVFDLAPGQSFVEFLLKQGYDVFVIDWNAPKQDESHLRLEDYVLDFIPSCVERVMQETGEPDVSIIGYCMGGVLSTIYAALHADGPLKNLVCMTTPINWHAMGLPNVWSDKRYFDVDRLVDALGVVPADMVTASFEMLRPAQRIAGQIQLWDNMWNDEFVKSWRMFDRWGAETLPLAGEYFRQTTKELMWENKLARGELVLGGRKVDLGAIKVPLMHAIAEHDHIAPYAATRELVQLVGSQDKEEVILKGGHVSLIAGPNAVKRLWPRIDAWLGVRSV